MSFIHKVIGTTMNPDCPSGKGRTGTPGERPPLLKPNGPYQQTEPNLSSRQEGNQRPKTSEQRQRGDRKPKEGGNTNRKAQAKGNDAPTPRKKVPVTHNA